MKINYLNGPRLLRAMLAGSSQMVKIHIHSNEPDVVFTILEDYGDLSKKKQTT
ncbi:MAG: hypothetical protein IH880_03845 [Candidatus Marinimicrobia bacterium]|nr:hypothetical protein [Candidatus Neomarinimicrobiota bacterium]